MREFRAKFKYCCEQARELGVIGTLILWRNNFYCVGMLPTKRSVAMNDNEAKP